MEIRFPYIYPYEKKLEIRFVRNGKKNMDENPFARCDRRESESYYLAPWIFSQIFLVVEHKSDFRVNRLWSIYAYKNRCGFAGKAGLGK